MATPAEIELHNHVAAVCRPASSVEPAADVVYAVGAVSMLKHARRDALNAAIKVLISKGIATNEVVEAIRGLE